MKNDIDDILNSMFRGGRLNVKGSEKQEGSERSAVSEKDTDADDMNKKLSGMLEELRAAAENTSSALDGLERTTKAKDDLSRTLQENIEQLTREARSDMADLSRHLREDGLDKDSVALNSGNAQQISSAFDIARAETASRVLGQEDFISALVIAFKRPFVAGISPDLPACRAAILGKEGTGRHSALEILTASLGRQGILKSPKVTYVNLERYTTPDSEKLFVQDLYAALKSGAPVIAFEGFEKAHISTLSLVSSLFKEGCVHLSGRYAEQKGMLVDIGTALVPGAVSSLSGAGKYLFLITERSEAKLTDALGAPFVSSLDDICVTAEFTHESLLEIADRILKELCEKIRKKLGFDFSYTQLETELLAGSCSPRRGAGELKHIADGLYKALSELKLRSDPGAVKGEFRAENAKLTAVYKTELSSEVTLQLSEDNTSLAAATEAIKSELSEIVGLSTVKEYILSLEDNFNIQQMRISQGLKADSPSMHMIFTGNPGTGKTTIARIVSRYLKAIGILKGGQLVEVTRADLVGRYVGHTAPLTQKAIQSALGGVLFIDEAYSLYRGKDDSFGLEAIDTLVKGMEDHREDLVVILAGYSHEMAEFLTANSGLRSRFPNIIEFPDYTAQELLDITKSIVKGKGYRMSEGCDTLLLDFYRKAQSEGDPRTNGNGRMARNKVEEAVIACSRRNIKTPEAERNLELLLPEDFFPNTSKAGEA